MDPTSVVEICSCGVSLKLLNNGGGKACHLRSKTHDTYLKYKDIIVDNKITCVPCGITMKVMSYDGHQTSNMHMAGISRNNKFVCECGETIFEFSKERHLKSKSHIDKLHPSDNKNVNKIAQYQANIDIVNCCKRCLKVSVPDQYFIPFMNLCLCCDEILKGGEKRCINCKEMKDINTFERPYLIRCKKCACLRTKRYYYSEKPKESEPYIHDVKQQESSDWLYKIKV